jgi:hypothetical protein
LILGGAGTQTAALGFGGYSPWTTATEEWNGAGSPNNKNNHSFLTLDLFI